jgi:hypothetical protein
LPKGVRLNGFKTQAVACKDKIFRRKRRKGEKTGRFYGIATLQDFDFLFLANFLQRFPQLTGCNLHLINVVFPENSIR